jgi:hypothetical protein
MAKGELVRISPPDTLPASMMRRELSYRKAYGVEVALTWLAFTNELELSYVDEGENLAWVSIVPNNKGNDAFAHPGIYRPKEVE